MAGHIAVKASGRLILQAKQDQTRPNFKNFYYFPCNRGMFKNIVLNSPRNLGSIFVLEDNQACELLAHS
jgi:hypothetical protein